MNATTSSNSISGRSSPIISPKSSNENPIAPLLLLYYFEN